MLYMYMYIVYVATRSTGCFTKIGVDILLHVHTFGYFLWLNDYQWVAVEGNLE